MIDSLNPQQQQAVTQPAQHTLILAGAGSGKTRVLTTRMAWLMQQGLSPYALMAVTFTNKAAREMLTRLSALLPIDTRGMWVGTFHGLCNRLLRLHHQDAGLVQSFQILDSADQLAAIRRLLKANNIDDEKYPARDVQRFINAEKEKGLRPHAIEAYDPHTRRLVELYELYQAQCEREGVVDFAELLLRAYELLLHHAPLRQHYQQRFSHILIDEFQDTNPLQYAWLTLLAGDQACLFAVGDDDQSIYAFRGADISNMKCFERDYAKGNVVRLEQNYRSSGHILDAANALISHNADRLGKKLWTDSGQGEAVRVVEKPSDALEAQWVVEEIKALLKDGYAPDQVAVLYRSNAQSRVLEHQLFSSAIPYKVYGGQRFFERQEIKHVLAYLRLIDNPNDDTSWLRVVNFPTRGIGARSLEQLGDYARQYSCSLYRAVPYMTGRAGSNLGKFVALINQLAAQAQMLPLPDLIEQVIHDSGLLEHYKNDREGADRLENLQELVNAATVFIMEEGLTEEVAGRIPVSPEPAVDENGMAVLSAMSPLAAFLSHASLEAGDNQAQAGQAAVQLMTIHAAKGLEFDAVFITGLEEGLFPHENSLAELNGLEEERRLMYVALTRGRRRVYLTLAQSRMLHGKTRYATRSRFLDELPDAHLKWLTPRQAAPIAQSAWVGGFGREAHGWNQARQRATAGMASTVAKSGLIVGDQHFRVGQGVAHPKFGEGTILTLSGSGNEAQAQIHFREAGTKTLALGVAKLTIIAGG